MRDNVPETSIARARAMRRTPTEAERKLWYMLRDRRLNGVKFRRQVPVGPYVADFLCVSRRLAIEADGSQHADSARDARRDAWFAANGFRVLRFWNGQILHERESVMATILDACGLPW